MPSLLQSILAVDTDGDCVRDDVFVELPREADSDGDEEPMAPA